MVHRGSGMSADAEVPGMKDAVESRRLALGLRPADFNQRSGLSHTQIQQVRDGRRKRYNDKTVFGVARALQWRNDWYQRLLNGEAPMPAEVDAGGAGNLEQRVLALESSVSSLADRVDSTDQKVDRILRRLEEA